MTYPMEPKAHLGLLCIGSVFMVEELDRPAIHSIPDVSSLRSVSERVDVVILDLRANANPPGGFKALRSQYPRAFMLALVDSWTTAQDRVEANKAGCDDFVALHNGLSATSFAIHLLGALASPESRHRVLVVDDDANNRELLEQELGDANLDVRLAPDGPTALLVGPWADLVLLDITMPLMDGREVCRQLRANARTAQIPVIMLTALDQILDKVQAYEMGANDYITKPYDADHLIAKIRRLLWRAEAQRLSWNADDKERGR